MHSLQLLLCCTALQLLRWTCSVPRLQEAAAAAGASAPPALFPSDERIAEVLYDIMGEADLNVSAELFFGGL